MRPVLEVASAHEMLLRCIDVSEARKGLIVSGGDDCAVRQGAIGSSFEQALARNSVGKKMKGPRSARHAHDCYEHGLPHALKMPS